jgi:glycosyltransferase involved in cell wall biosynthesis
MNTSLLDRLRQFQASPPITIVIPIHNEEGNLKRLFIRLKQTFDQIGCQLPVLAVDDGSTDGSYEILERLQNECMYLRVVHHPSRRGVAQVMRTALLNTRTEWMLWEQADLESDPYTDIPLLLGACTESVDCVAGWRENRGDGKSFASRLANATCQWAFDLQIHDMNWIKLVKRDLMAAVPLDIVTHRYALAVLSGWGYRVTEVPTPWHPRYSGRTKFGRKRLFTSAVDFLGALWWFRTCGYAYRPVLEESIRLNSPQPSPDPAVS